MNLRPYYVNFGNECTVDRSSDSVGWSSAVVPPPAPPPAQKAGPALAATVLYTFAGTAGDELAVEEGDEVLQSLLHCTER